MGWVRVFGFFGDQGGVGRQHRALHDERQTLPDAGAQVGYVVCSVGLIVFGFGDYPIAVGFKLEVADVEDVVCVFVDECASVVVNVACWRLIDMEIFGGLRGGIGDEIVPILARRG